MAKARKSRKKRTASRVMLSFIETINLLKNIRAQMDYASKLSQTIIQGTNCKETNIPSVVNSLSLHVECIAEDLENYLEDSLKLVKKFDEIATSYWARKGLP